MLTIAMALAFSGALVACFWLRPRVEEAVVQHPSEPRTVATTGSEAGTATTRGGETADIEELRHRDLLVPVEGADPGTWKGAFEEKRGGHVHEAVDILAPRNTPVRAVDVGTIAKLFLSKAGGLTLYERDMDGRFMYYYAHLEGYAAIHEGDVVVRGQIIGYVGTSGNAPKDTPHLHFAIFRLEDPRRWWKGQALDPYLAYGR